MSNFGGGIIRVPVLGALLLAVVVAVGAFVFFNNQFGTPSVNSVEEHKVVKPQSQTDLSLGGVDVGVEVARLKEILGAPESVENLDGYELYRYSNIKAEVRNGKVYALMTDAPDVTTSKGIHVGLHYSEVITQYGSKANETQEKFTVYEYSFESLNHEKGVLRFSVDGPHISNTVVQISARILVAPPSDNNFEQAKLALHKFINTIARKDYEKAYDEMLTNNYKSKVSKKEFTLRGAQLTELNFDEVFTEISSKENSVVLGYSAGSRTKNNNQTIYTPWKGEIEMVFESGVWKINVVTAERGESIPEK